MSRPATTRIACSARTTRRDTATTSRGGSVRSRCSIRSASAASPATRGTATPKARVRAFLYGRTSGPAFLRNRRRVHRRSQSVRLVQTTDACGRDRGEAAGQAQLTSPATAVYSDPVKFDLQLTSLDLDQALFSHPPVRTAVGSRVVRLRVGRSRCRSRPTRVAWRLQRHDRATPRRRACVGSGAVRWRWRVSADRGAA